MTLAIFSTVEWTAMLVIVVPIVASAVVQIITAIKAAQKVEEVKIQLKAADIKKATALKEIKDVADATHTLVNGRLSVQLEHVALLAIRIAELTKDPIDIAAANKAVKLRDEHAKQEESITL